MQIAANPIASRIMTWILYTMSRRAARQLRQQYRAESAVALWFRVSLFRFPLL